MTSRFVVALFALAPLVTTGQAPSPASQAPRTQAAQPYTPRRGPDGQPD